MPPRQGCLEELFKDDIAPEVVFEKTLNRHRARGLEEQASRDLPSISSFEAT